MNPHLQGQEAPSQLDCDLDDESLQKQGVLPVVTSLLLPFITRLLPLPKFIKDWLAKLASINKHQDSFKAEQSFSSKIERKTFKSEEGIRKIEYETFKSEQSFSSKIELSAERK